jgi:hypothetical protein
VVFFTTALGLYGGVLWSGELQRFIIHEMMPSNSNRRALQIIGYAAQGIRRRAWLGGGVRGCRYLLLLYITAPEARARDELRTTHHTHRGPIWDLCELFYDLRVTPSNQ